MPFQSVGMGGGGGAGGNGTYPAGFVAYGGQRVSGTSVLPGMLDVYNQLLGLNQNNYQNVLNSYSNANTALTNQLGDINNTLGLGRALGQGGNWGVAQPAADAIAASYAKARGSNVQNMISSGLGNSTLLGQMQNQAAGMAAQSYGNLGAQLATTAAGYQAQTMQARNALAQSFMGNLAGYRFANTAGDLTGQFSASQDAAGGGGGSHGGGGGGGYSQRNWDPMPGPIGSGGGNSYSGNAGANQGYWYGGQGPAVIGGGGGNYQLGGEGSGTDQRTNDWYSSSDYYNSNSSYSGGGGYGSGSDFWNNLGSGDSGFWYGDGEDY